MRSLWAPFRILRETRGIVHSIRQSVQPFRFSFGQNLRLIFLTTSPVEAGSKFEDEET